MPSNAYNTLLAAVQDVKLFLTPSRQTYVQLPTEAVPLWSEEFFTWCIAKYNFQNFPASSTYNTVLRTLDEKAHAQPRETIRPANLRTAATKQGYEIDLGDQVIQITGKEWKIEPRLATFLRPFANRPLPIPNQSETKLADHLRAAFGLNAASPKEDDPAKALGQWLEMALRPDTHCPPLILTGELRDEAAEALRNLIDPASCAMLPFPTSRSQAGWMALYNRVLAFPLYGAISEFKRKTVKALATGTFAVRLRQADKKRVALTEFLGRPVIITAEQAPEITGNQIVIEIKKCAPFPHQKVLAALLTQMVRSLRDEPNPRPESTYIESAILPQSFAFVEANAPVP